MDLIYESPHVLTFTTEWQEVEVGDLRSQEGTCYGCGAGGITKFKIVWEGELLDLALHIWLSSQEVTPSHPEDMPEALEIDWIQLTGAEEQLQGEGAPPVVEALVPFGGYFAPAAFSPLGRGVWTPTWIPMAALGDVDGDQDLDLVTMWVAPAPSADMGWLVATNEGQGRFVTRRSESGPQPFYLGGGDVDGDGLLDLVLRQGTAPLRLLHNKVQMGWVVEQEFPGERYLGVGDADGDGDADLWTTSQQFPALIFNNLGGFCLIFRCNALIFRVVFTNGLVETVLIFQTFTARADRPGIADNQRFF